MKRIDLTGQTFGMRTIAGPSPTRRRYWMFRCECGRRGEVYAPDLRRYSSCGCIRIAQSTVRLTIHGMHGHPAWLAWLNLRKRCQNPNDISFPNYGGRGISVCQEWESFEAFWRDMGPTWRKGLSIDRINNNGNYEAANCHWATKSEQAKNRRNGPRPRSPMDGRFLSARRLLSGGISSAEPNRLC